MFKLKAILWDNDGVLVDTEHLYFQACRETLERVDITLDESQFIDLFLRKSEGIVALLAEHGISENLDQLQNWRNRRYTQLLASGVKPIDGVVETLSKLHGRFKMGIVTSSKRAHFDVIHTHTNLLQFFDFVLAREDYHFSKPDPEPYIEAMKRNNLLVEECIAIEDSPRGLCAAQGAGLRCVVIPRGLTENLNFDGAWKQLQCVEELIAIADSN